jgi:hypothetical protein
MLPLMGRLARKIWSFNATVVLLLLGLALGTPLLSAQSAAPLEQIHSLLMNHPKLAQEHGNILVAEITKMEAIRRNACKSGIEHRVTYRVVENLWVEPDSPVEPGYVITKGSLIAAKSNSPRRRSPSASKFFSTAEGSISTTVCLPLPTQPKIQKNFTSGSTLYVTTKVTRRYFKSTKTF